MYATLIVTTKNMAKNPLIQYKEDHNVTWREIIEQSGLAERTIFDLIKKGPKGLLLCTINTAMILKDTLDIDLVKFIRNNLHKT